ncbi:putative ATP-dependent acetyltransferase [Escherichia coli]|uniref:Putative ATP-dependent acetyltransferase n=1 Tax=Escherichia coli TaxID=562 RepID=A0A376Y615_ECOLX|nr:putative ATP-dependent acetyltransferase [Escherichia coli]
MSITVYVAMRKLLAQWNGETLPVDPLNDAVLSDDDWLELAGFAFAHRPLLTSLGCLLRLLQTSELALPALRGAFTEKRQ